MHEGGAYSGIWPVEHKSIRMAHRMNDVPPLSASSRALVAESWATRWLVEVEAEMRFRDFAERLASAGFSKDLSELAAKAAADERRHASHCEELALAYGHAPVRGTEPKGPAPIAPHALAGPQKLLYEVTAACCVAETESTGTLVTLVDLAQEPRIKEVCHELARDEITHARLGWATLEAARGKTDLAFLAPYVPAMWRNPMTEAMFGAPQPEREDPALAAYGVLPLSKQREVFVQTLRDVVFPGFSRMGIDVSAGQRWLDARVS
jgi:hypothetical protein